MQEYSHLLYFVKFYFKETKQKNAADLFQGVSGIFYIQLNNTSLSLVLQGGWLRLHLVHYLVHGEVFDFQE